MASQLKHLDHCIRTILCPHRQLISQRTYATLKTLTRNVQHADLEGTGVGDEEFRVLVIPGYTDLEFERREKKTRRRLVQPPRYKSMNPEQDWTNVWPAAQTFKWSVVPFPVRQGFIERMENDGIPPVKYANAELMKIPNFLHLTPAHIKKHCAVLKQFCTEWPKELTTDEKCDQHFPIETITQDYVFDGPSIRDFRARTVTLKVKLSSLDLDYHARDKMIRLAKHRYNPKTDVLTIMTDRCPLKSQNTDYAHYLLTALYHESWKTEPWEAEKTVADMERFEWDVMESKDIIVDLVKRQLQATSDGQEKPAIGHLSELSRDASGEDINKVHAVQQYKDAVTSLHNDGEDVHNLDKLKAASMALLLPKVN